MLIFFPCCAGGGEISPTHYLTRFLRYATEVHLTRSYVLFLYVNVLSLSRMARLSRF